MRAGSSASIVSRRRRARTGELPPVPMANHHLAAIDDGGKNEGRKIRTVDDIDGETFPARTRGHFIIEPVAGRRDDGRHIAQAGREGIAEADLEPALAGSRRRLFRNVGAAGKPAHMRSGGAQQPQLGERGLARADKNKDASSRGIEEDRKEPHRRPSPHEH